LIGNLGAAKFLLVPKFEKGQVVKFEVDESNCFHSYQELTGLFDQKDRHMVATSGSAKYLLRPEWKKGKIVGFEHVKDTSDTLKVMTVSIGHLFIRYKISRRSFTMSVFWRKKGKGIPLNKMFEFDEMNFYI
jgi:hypothetical protein